MTPADPRGLAPRTFREVLRELLRQDEVLLAVVSVLFVWLAYLAPPDMFGGLDFRQVHSLYKEYMAKAISAGRLPLWNPHVNLGRPFHADSDAAILYPPHLLYLVVEVRVAWAILACAHVWLALAGTTRLLRAMDVRRVVALGLAVGFVASSPLVEPFQNGVIHYAIGLCYLPWAFLFALRLQDQPAWSTAWKLALVVGMQYLGGHVQVSWLTIAGISLFLLGRGPGRSGGAWKTAWDLARVAGCCAWGLALAGAQLLPMLELASQGNRHPSLAFTDSFRMPWFGWFSFLTPPGPRFPVAPQFNLFCGAFILVGGLLGLTRLRDRTIRGWLVLAAVAALVGAGNVTPLFRFAHAWVPGFSSFRMHSRSLVLTTLALVSAGGVLLGSGAAKAPTSAGLRTRLRLIGVLALAATLSVELHAIPVPFPASSAHALARAVFVVAAWALIHVLLRWREATVSAGAAGPGTTALTRLQIAAVVVLVACAGADLALSVARLKTIRSSTPNDAPEEGIAEILRRDGLIGEHDVPPRVSFPGNLMRPNAGMHFGFSTFAGYTSLSLDRTFSFMHGVLGLAEPLANTFPSGAIYNAGPFPYDSMSLVLGYDPKRGLPALRRQTDPRAYLAYAAEVVPSWREAIQRMRQGHDFHRIVLLEEPSPQRLIPPVTTREPIVGIRRFEPERIEIDVTSEAAGLLVLGEAWYPGWKAKVNGQAVPCLPGNVWMRVVPVPAGSSRVELAYSSTYLPFGAALSGVALIAILAVAFLGRRRRQLAGDTPSST